MLQTKTKPTLSKVRKCKLSASTPVLKHLWCVWQKRTREEVPDRKILRDVHIYAKNSSWKSHRIVWMILYVLGYNGTYYTYVFVHGHGEHSVAELKDSLQKLSRNETLVVYQSKLSPYIYFWEERMGRCGLSETEILQRLENPFRNRLLGTDASYSFLKIKWLSSLWNEVKGVL